MTSWLYRLCGQSAGQIADYLRKRLNEQDERLAILVQQYTADLEATRQQYATEVMTPAQEMQQQGEEQKAREHAARGLYLLARQAGFECDLSQANHDRAVGQQRIAELRRADTEAKIMELQKKYREGLTNLHVLNALQPAQTPDVPITRFEGRSAHDILVEHLKSLNLASSDTHTEAHKPMDEGTNSVSGTKAPMPASSSSGPTSNDPNLKDEQGLTAELEQISKRSREARRNLEAEEALAAKSYERGDAEDGEARVTAAHAYFTTDNQCLQYERKIVAAERNQVALLRGTERVRQASSSLEFRRNQVEAANPSGVVAKSQRLLESAYEATQLVFETPIRTPPTGHDEGLAERIRRVRAEGEMQRQRPSSESQQASVENDDKGTDSHIQELPNAPAVDPDVDLARRLARLKTGTPKKPRYVPKMVSLLKKASEGVEAAFKAGVCAAATVGSFAYHQLLVSKQAHVKRDHQCRYNERRSTTEEVLHRSQLQSDHADREMEELDEEWDNVEPCLA